MDKIPVNDFFNTYEIEKHKIGGCFVTYDKLSYELFIIDSQGNKTGLSVDKDAKIF